MWKVFFTKKWLTIHIERKHHPSEFKHKTNRIIPPDEQKQDNNPSVSTYENLRYVFIGPSNVRKTHYMLKVLEKISNKRPIHIITRSPIQYPNYKTSIDNKPTDKDKGSVVNFHDMLGPRNRNSSQVDECFTRAGREILDVYYISQS